MSTKKYWYSLSHTHTLTGHTEILNDFWTKIKSFFFGQGIDCIVFFLNKCHHHHQSSSHHRTHKALTAPSQRERSWAPLRISLQANCMVLSSFSVDLFQVVVGLPRCLYPSGVQNRPFFSNVAGFSCPIRAHFLRVNLTMMSSCSQILRTSRFVNFCGHLMSNIMRTHLITNYCT